MNKFICILSVLMGSSVLTTTLYSIVTRNFLFTWLSLFLGIIITILGVFYFFKYSKESDKKYTSQNTLYYVVYSCTNGIHSKYIEISSDVDVENILRMFKSIIEGRSMWSNVIVINWIKLKEKK